MFNPENILADELMFFEQSLAFDFKAWLQERSPFLSTYTINGESFLEFALNAAKNLNVNPKLLFCTLQREQSLLSAKEPSDEQLKRACGYGAEDNGDIKADYGFSTQIIGCMNTYMSWFQKWTQGASLSVDYGKAQIVPSNALTYALYKYCPHIGTETSPDWASAGGAYGNYLLWKLWNEYWPEDFIFIPQEG